MSTELFNPTVLIDADSIYYRVCAVISKDKKKLTYHMKKDIDRAIKNTMDTILKDTNATASYVAVKGQGNFRKELDPTYKGHRPELDPVMKECLNYGHKHMVDKYGAVMADNMEADDLVSIWHYELAETGGQSIIAGIDKDLLQIPTWHYNFHKKELQYVDEDYADYLFHVQCLTGDGADNIRGIKGIGPKKAERILHGVPLGRRWGRVKAAWRKHKAGDPTPSWRLLKMLTTWKEYDTIRSELESKTSVSQSDDGKEQDVQDSSL